MFVNENNKDKECNGVDVYLSQNDREGSVPLLRTWQIARLARPGSIEPSSIMILENLDKFAYITEQFA